MIRFALLLVGATLYPSIFAAPTEVTDYHQLVCTGEDDSDSIVCQFRVPKSASGDQSQRKRLGESCLESDDGDYLCVQGMISTSVKKNVSTKEKATIASKETKISQNHVIVGTATYRQPFSQYGEAVAGLLQKKPTKPKPMGAKATSLIEQAAVMAYANWLMDLGMAHIQTVAGKNGSRGAVMSLDPVRDDQWYQMELALNALREGLALFPHIAAFKASSSNQLKLELSVTALEPYLFVASVRNQIGEVFMTHPDSEYEKEALESLEQGKILYDVVRYNIHRQTSKKEKAGSYLDDQLFDEDYRSIELRWADIVTRICTLRESQLMLDNMGYSDAELEKMSQSMNLGGAVPPPPPEYIKTLKSINKMQKSALQVYESVVKSDDKAPSNISQEQRWEAIATKMSLASAYQTASVISTLLEDFPASWTFLQKALYLQEQRILPHLKFGSEEYDASIGSIADILVALADSAFAQGKYSDADRFFKRAMNFHQKHNVPPPPSPAVPDGMEDPNTDMLQVYIDTLAQYHEALANDGRFKVPADDGSLDVAFPRGTIDDGETGESGDEYYIEEDPNYEGDLHASIGALYLGQEHVEMAVKHLEKAIELYRSLQMADDAAVAEALVNLAAAKFRNREFLDAAKIQSEALAIYKQVYGDGVAPFMDEGMEESGLEGFDDDMLANETETPGSDEL